MMLSQLTACPGKPICGSKVRCSKPVSASNVSPNKPFCDSNVCSRELVSVSPLLPSKPIYAGNLEIYYSHRTNVKFGITNRLIPVLLDGQFMNLVMKRTLPNLNVNEQVTVFNWTILNILKNFIPMKLLYTLTRTRHGSIKELSP